MKIEFMPLIDHYKIFIDSRHKKIITAIHNNNKLEIYLYEGINERNEIIMDQFNEIDYISFDILKTKELEKEIENFILKKNSEHPIDLIILHEKFKNRTKFDHLSILRICNKLVPNTCSVLCNTNNFPNHNKSSFTEIILHFFTENLFIHLMKIKKSGYKISSKYCILDESGLPDKIISFNKELQNIHHNKMQSQRTLIGRTLVQILVYMKLSPLISPGYFFILEKC